MTQPVFTRRDRRFSVRPGTARIELDRPTGSCAGTIRELSVGGFLAELDELDGSVVEGVHLAPVTLTFAACELRGTATVLFVDRDDETIRLGCLFFPDDAGSADRLMALLAGFESATP